MPHAEKELKWERPRSLAETVNRYPTILRFVGLGFLEWLFDWVLYGFDRLALLRMPIQAFLAASVVGGVLLVWNDLAEREDERVLRAWKVLADGASIGYNLGQKDAVEFLVAKGRSLAQVPLPGADLSNIDLQGLDLHGANLDRADLRGANLSGANLSKALFGYGDLSGANLRGCDLSSAHLYEANLTRANLSGADLRKANLTNANLGEANLAGANLSGTVLDGVDLSGANLRDVTGLQSLNLSKTTISDLTPLRGLVGLQSLYLNRTAISDLSPLRGLTALQSLDLRGTAVSDLTPLHALASLRTLYLDQTQTTVASEEIAALRAALPNLQIQHYRRHRP